jgi:NADH-quinone oxidoreductase subunit F
MRGGHRLKFWTPGGSSTPLLTDEHLDVPLDFESVAAAGSMLGTRSLQIFDETTCVVRRGAPLDRVLPARVVRQVHAVPGGHVLAGPDPGAAGTRRGHRRRPGQDAGHLRQHHRPGVLRARRQRDAADHLAIKYFRDEFIQHHKEGGCPFDPAASTLWSDDRIVTVEAETKMTHDQDTVTVTIDGFEIAVPKGTW